MECAFPNCVRRATRYETIPELPHLWIKHADMSQSVVRAFCPDHYGEDECPTHISSVEGDPKICRRCGIHIDSLRP